MTLVEVLVATVILGIGVTGLLSAATLAMRNQQRSEYRAQALFVAQERLAEVERVGPHIYLLSKPMKGATPVGEQEFGWTVQIEQQPVGEMFSVGVDVSWGGGAGGSVQLATWLNDYAAKSALMPRDENAGPSQVNVPPGGGG